MPRIPSPMVRRGLLLAFALTASLAVAQPSPKEFLGHEVCEDYMLANYKQLTAYWRALEKASPRIKVVSIGKSEEGREQYMAIISDPANLRNLETHRKNSERLARANTFKDDEEARRLAKTAKAVVWIDGGLHASEVLGHQQLIEQAWQLVSRNDEENRRILKDTIILLVHANPDGMDLVSDWYMRRSDPKTRSAAGLPVLYQKYCGHDNNRDFYANNMAETRNMNHVLYNQWYPQIVYNHHQSAPQGTIMYIPPFRNPFNYHVDPLVQIGTDLVGIHMHKRLIGEGKGGTVMRNGASFSAWWNGGLRTTTYFHNMVGILTETWGSPDPRPVPFLKERQIPSTDLPKPIDTRLWHLRDSLEYEVGANYAILDYASRYRERLLFDLYRAARNSIERGQRDHWTRYPARITEVGEAALARPELRDAHLYVMRSDQPDFATAMKFAVKLQQCGVEVQQLTSRAGDFPAGSLVVRCDQAFRPHVLDMFEPQDHPNDFQYPGGPPIRPYDNAGYTLAYQMGVQFDRVLDPIAVQTAPFLGLPKDRALPRIATDTWFANDTQNDAFALANLALASGIEVRRTEGGFLYTGRGEAMTRWLSAFPQAHLQPAVGRSNEGSPVRQPRVALWDTYGGSMASGWMRYLFEQFAVNFQVVFPPDLDAGSLRSKFDVIVFPSGAIPGGGSRGGGGGGQSALANDPTVPEEYRRRIGLVSVDKTIPLLREFVEQGGTILAIGSSAGNLAAQFQLPIKSALVETDPNGRERPIPNTAFYIPGSVLRAKVVPGSLTRGMGEAVDVLFDDSPAFKVDEAGRDRVTVAAFYDTDKPLRSGWAWGQEKLKDAVAVAEVTMGQGRVVLYGPEVAFRAQPHGTFKLMFNAMLR